MNYFGGRKDPKAAARDSIVQLRQQLILLEKKEDHLQKKIDEELKVAKSNAVSNKAGESLFVFLHVGLKRRFELCVVVVGNKSLQWLSSAKKPTKTNLNV